MFPNVGASFQLIRLACKKYRFIPVQKYLSTQYRRVEHVSGIESIKYFHQSSIVCGITPVKMPSLSPTMTEGTIVKWLKQEGDKIVPGDVLCEIQTDKAVVSLEFDEEGILAKVLIAENSSDIKVGTPIALVVDEGDDWKNVKIPKDLEIESLSSKTSTTPSQHVSPPSVGMTTHVTSTKSLIGPAVRNLLNHYGLNATQIRASGSHRNLLKGDILRQIEEQKLEAINIARSHEDATLPITTSSNSVARSAPAPFIDLEITSMRRTIAKRLLQSKSSIPHAYATTECTINGILALRKRMQKAGLKVSVNDFIIKCTGNALGRVPGVNVIWEGSELRQKGEIDISVAVSTDTGLITPIVTNVAVKDILQISKDVAQLAAKARNGKLQPHEFMGGTFTISNLGMYGIHNFSAIINPPQCAILAVGGGHAYIENTGEVEDRVNLTLSYDAIGISEELALKFLAHLKHDLESTSEVTIGIYNIEACVDSIELLQSLTHN